MGSYGVGPMDNDKAADMMGDMLDYLYKKYFNSEKKPKASLSADELIALGHIFCQLDKAGGICRVEQEYTEELIDAIKNKANEEYYNGWKYVRSRKRTVTLLINRLVRTL